MTSRLLSATSRKSRATVSCTWCRLRSASPRSAAFIAMLAAPIASRALCASSSMLVLLDLDARCLEDGVVLAVPVHVAQHADGNDKGSDDEAAHGDLLRVCP